MASFWVLDSFITHRSDDGELRAPWAVGTVRVVSDPQGPPSLPRHITSPLIRRLTFAVGD